MKKKFAIQSARHRVAASLALSCFLPAIAYSQTTGWNKANAGPHDYNDTANWVGGTPGDINGIWDSSLILTANQTATFGANTALTSGLQIGYDANNATANIRNLTLQANGTGPYTLTLAGNISVTPVKNEAVTLGSSISGNELNLNLGGNRTATIAGGSSLQFFNSISGGNLTITGNANAPGGLVTFKGNTAAPGTAMVTRSASLSFDSGTSGNTGTTRATSVELAGGSLILNGNADANTSEVISGALTVSAGQSNNSITLTPDASGYTQLTADSLTRGANSSVFFRGTNLGVNSIASQTDGSANILFTSAPALTGGTLGTPAAGILPWAIADTTASGLGSTFATYDGTNGVRKLSPSEYSTTVATDGSTDDHNIKLTASGSALTADGATTINSLFIDSSGVTPGTVLSGTGSLSITSGAVFIDIATMTGANGSSLTIAKNIDFGSTRGILGTTGSANQRRISFSGGISGTGGVMFYDTGVNAGQAAGYYLAHANSYTGDTYINGHVTLAHLNALPNASNGGRTGNVYLNGILKLSVKDLAVQINGLWGYGTVFSEYTNSNKTLIVGDNDATSTFDGRFSAGGGSMNLAKIGSGTLTLTATDSANAGTTAVRKGTLSVITLNSVVGGTATSSLGAPVTALAGTIALGSGATTGTLEVKGTGETTDRVINLAGNTGGAAIDQSGTGLLKFTSDLTATGGGSKTLTLQGSTAGTGEIAGAIVDNSGTNKTRLDKLGTGTWVLSGTNTYTGDTNVIEGTLSMSTPTLADTSIVNVQSTGVLHLTHGGVDTVADFQIDGVSQGNGNFNAANSSGRITGSGSIQVGPSSDPFVAWIDTFTSLTDPADKTKTADPDQDGVNNFAEFALNGNPSDGSDNGLTASLLQDTTAPAGDELTYIIAVRDGATFSAAAGGVQTATVAADSLTYTVEGSLDLVFPGSTVSHVSTSDTAPAATGLPDLTGTAWEYHTFRLDASEGLGGKGFLRVGIQ